MSKKTPSKSTHFLFKKHLWKCSFSVFLSSHQLQRLLKGVKRHELCVLFILLCLQKSDSFLWYLITVWAEDDLINDHLLSAVVLCLVRVFSSHRISLVVESLNRRTVNEINHSLLSQIWNSDDSSTQLIFERQQQQWQQQQHQLRESENVERWEREEWEADSSEERDQDNHYKDSDHESEKKRQVIDVKITINSKRERNKQNI